MLLDATVIAFGLVLSQVLNGLNLLEINFSLTGRVYPDFLLIFAIFFALRRGEFSGLWIGFFAGLLEDSQIVFTQLGLGEGRGGQYIIGVHAIIYTLAGFVLGKLNRVIDRDSTLPIMFVVLATVFLCRLIVWGMMGLLFQPNASYPFFGPAIYSAIIAPIWFGLLGWIYRQTNEEETAQ